MCKCVGYRKSWVILILSKLISRSSEKERNQQRKRKGENAKQNIKLKLPRDSIFSAHRNLVNTPLSFFFSPEWTAWCFNEISTVRNVQKWVFLSNWPNSHTHAKYGDWCCFTSTVLTSFIFNLFSSSAFSSRNCQITKQPQGNKDFHFVFLCLFNKKNVYKKAFKYVDFKLTQRYVFMPFILICFFSLSPFSPTLLSLATRKTLFRARLRKRNREGREEQNFDLIQICLIRQVQLTYIWA